MQAAPIPTATAPNPLPESFVCDTTRRFVRVTETRADGLVAFDFAIGWPELSVELLLPADAFEEFCATNRVERLAP
ncbi:MAG: phenol hydroxylase [Rubrivivax sp. SCN 70-15]|nr:MAG: phenol hydroxylase [Rubrivivax sp. SCN 70-15]